jgi:hypothetical protein
VGSIGAKSSDLYIGKAESGLLFDVTGADGIRPFNTTAQGESDGNLDLGSSSSRFKDLYLSGGVYLGGTGSANKLDDYEEGTWDPVFADSSAGGNSVYGAYGYYTKVGNSVTAWAKVGNMNTSGLSTGNSLFIRNFPFTAGNTTGFGLYTGACNVSDITSEGSPVVSLYDNSTYGYFDDSNGAILVSDCTNGAADIYFTITYQTA